MIGISRVASRIRADARPGRCRRAACRSVITRSTSLAATARRPSRTVPRQSRPAIALAREQQLDDLREPGIVVDDEDALPGRPGCARPRRSWMRVPASRRAARSRSRRRRAGSIRGAQLAAELVHDLAQIARPSPVPSPVGLGGEERLEHRDRGARAECPARCRGSRARPRAAPRRRPSRSTRPSPSIACAAFSSDVEDDLLRAGSAARARPASGVAAIVDRDRLRRRGGATVRQASTTARRCATAASGSPHAREVGQRAR